MSLFRKPKRNVRQRQISDGDDENGADRKGKEEDESLQELQSNINKFKEIRLNKSKKDKRNSNSSGTKAEKDEKKSLLSFEEDLVDGDDGEVFQVKKSSQSRRLIKQLKSEKKKGSSSNKAEKESTFGIISPPPPNISREKTTGVNELDPELNIKFKDNITKKSWILAGKEAEALHMEEEDRHGSGSDSDSHNGRQDPLQKILQSGSIPDAAAIHAARKQREALREGRKVDSKSKDFIPVTKRNARMESEVEHGDSDSGEEGRINFTGVRTDAMDRSKHFEEMGVNKADVSHDDEEESWERHQINKAINSNRAAGILPPLPPILSSQDENGDFPEHESALKRPEAYNLQGMKNRVKERLESLKEVNSRHEKDLDRAVDEMVDCQDNIENCEKKIPDLVERHRFYQDLRGYITDLVECYDEKLTKIKYLEDKFYTSKAEICNKIMERRREDVRDQMKELSSTSKPPLLMDQAETTEEEARQRRAAEREGRRRRRMQNRKLTAGLDARMRHAEGMSSDDELSTSDQANIGKVRQDVESQARQIMGDVVEEFSSLEAVASRLEGWKEFDPSSYTDAFVQMCVPKIVSPLVRLQLLFWNPLAEHQALDTMPWYRQLANFSMNKFGSEDRDSLTKDPDRKLLSLIVEKVIVVKITSFVKHAYDPMSTTQSLKLTGLLERLISLYPTLTGESKQLRDLLIAVKEKLKSSLDNDVYIPIGYPKHFMENPLSQHVIFLNRQFWGAFKLFRNILSWQGILADQILGEMALNSLLNRYMAIGLGVMPDALEVFNKCRHIVGALPRPWLRNEYVFKLGLDRFAKCLVLMTKGTMRPHQRDVVKLLKTIGAEEDADNINRLQNSAV